MAEKYYTKSQMDDVATSVLRKYKIPHQWNGDISSVDIEALIEFDFCLDIEWMDISHFAQDGIVLAAILPKQKKVLMNEAQKDFFINKMGTANFSLAHELGHWVLHVTEQKDYEQLSFDDKEVFYCRSTSTKPPQEIQADMFAAALLMPREIIIGAISQLKLKGAVTFADLYRLKDQFGVSISALTRRAVDLKLLYLKDGTIFSSEDEAMGQTSMFQ